MSEWKEVQLKDFISVKGGLAYKSEYIGQGTALLLGMGCVSNKEKFLMKGARFYAGDYPHSYLVKPGDIVLATRQQSDNLPILGKPALIPNTLIGKQVIVGTNLYKVSKKANIDDIYLFWLLKGQDYQDHIYQCSSGTTVRMITKDSVEFYQFLIPPLPEQKAIALVLSSLDDKIDLLHRQNKTLEAMAETLFRQWFVEEAQEDWEDGKLGDVIELHYGKGLKTEERAGSGYPVVGSSGVVDYHTEFLVRGPGIVIGRKGTLGKVIYLWDNFYPIDTTYYVKSKVESVGLLYDYFLLKTIGFEDMNTDSAVPGLNRDIALSTEIKIPPEDKLHAFNELVADFIGKLKTNRDQIHTLEKLRDTLLPKLMSGEVRVAV
ncbi:MAG: restriction endonuclease subunit S [Actinobacteria bacterium]|nr:restriction endonuclease subunit S [Actinomycetota bacterium]